MRFAALPLLAAACLVASVAAQGYGAPRKPGKKHHSSSTTPQPTPQEQVADENELQQNLLPADFGLSSNSGRFWWQQNGAFSGATADSAALAGCSGSSPGSPCKLPGPPGTTGQFGESSLGQGFGGTSGCGVTGGSACGRPGLPGPAGTTGAYGETPIQGGNPFLPGPPGTTGALGETNLEGNLFLGGLKPGYPSDSCATKSGHACVEKRLCSNGRVVPGVRVDSYTVRNCNTATETCCYVDNTIDSAGTGGIVHVTTQRPGSPSTIPGQVHIPPSTPGDSSIIHITPTPIPAGPTSSGHGLVHIAPGQYGPITTGQPGYTPGQPGSIIPGQPGYVPGQPGSVNAGQPGYTPGQPGSVSPGQPGYVPGQPGSFSPGQPGYTPGKPGFVSPGQQGYVPGQPGSITPGQPGYYPGQPGSVSPGQSGYFPGQPGSVRPGQPGYTPGQPGSVSPGQSGYFPGQPGSVSPGQPGYTPGKPGFVSPGQPGYVPGQPGSVSPGQPGYTPGKPGSVSPGQPGYNPSQSGSVSPGYNPGKPGSVSPGQPGSVSPGQPGYTPGQPGSVSPGQPGSFVPGRPGQPVAVNPVQPGSGATYFPGQQQPGILPGLGGTTSRPSYVYGQQPQKPGEVNVPVSPNGPLNQQGNRGNDYYGVPIGGSIYDNNAGGVTPAGEQKPYTGPLNTTPHPGCAAALKCVTIDYCTAEGVMSDTPVYLTRDQQENRVPLSDCQNPDTGIVGKCCRDPNYKDPWPGGMMMMNGPQQLQDDCGPLATCRPQGSCAAGSTAQPYKSCQVPQDGSTGVCCLAGSPSGNPFFSGLGPVSGTKKPSFGYGPTTPSPGKPIKQPGFPDGSYSFQTTKYPSGVYQTGSYSGSVYQPGYQGSYQPGAYQPGAYQPSVTPGAYQPSSTPGYVISSTTPAPFQTPTSPSYQGSTSLAPYQPSSTPGYPGSSTLGPFQPPSGTRFPSGSRPVVSPGSGYPGSSTPGVPLYTGSTPSPYQPSSTPGYPSGSTGYYQTSISTGFPSSTPSPFYQTSTSVGFPASSTPGSYQPINYAPAAQPGAGVYTDSQGRQQPGIISSTVSPYQPSGPSFTNVAAGTVSYSKISLPTCGVSNKQRQGVPETDAANGEFPWQVIIYSDEQQAALCSGVIITEKAVLTAAHCVQGLESSDLTVKAGLRHPGDQPLAQSQVAATARHPTYDANTLFDDLALLVLQTPLPLGGQISAICLPPSRGAGPQTGCVASGWTKAALQGKARGQDNELHRLPINLIELDTCESLFKKTYLGKYFVLNKSFGCALPALPTANFCLVEAGSPVTCEDASGRQVLRGLYSWDVGCSSTNAPSALASIDVAWIESTLAMPIDELVRQELNEVLRKQQLEEQQVLDTEGKPGFAQGYGRK